MVKRRKHAHEDVGLLQQALDISARRPDRSIELARCLVKLHEQDHREFTRFIRQSTVGRRTAYLLLEVGTALRRTRLADSQLERIGWTKLHIVARQMTRANAEELVRLAENNTSQRLKVLIQGGEPRRNTRCVQLYFNSEQFQEFEKAVLDHGAKRSGRGLIQKEEAILNMIEKIR